MYLCRESALYNNANICLHPELYEFCPGVLEMILKFGRTVDYIHITRVPLTFQHKRIDVNQGPEIHLKEHSGNTQDERL